MLINGKEEKLAQECSLTELLAQLGYRECLVAVELNGAIVKRSAYSGIVITDADKLEIVSFVGGG